MEHVRSPLAVIFGLICLSGTIIVLFGHVHSFNDLTINHLYIILALTVTLGSGHFMWGAYSEGWGGIARGCSFTTLFIIGTVVCVGLSGGRSAAILAQRDYDADVAKADLHKQQTIVDRASADVTQSKSVYDVADTEATHLEQITQDECATGKKAGEGDKCKGKRSVSEGSRARADKLFDRYQEAKQAYDHELQVLNKIHLPPPPNTDLLPFAQLYALIAHISESDALAKVKLLLPYAFAVITEFGTVAFFQHGFGKPQPKPASLPTVALTDIAHRLNMKPDEARKKLRALGVARPSQGWVFTAPDASKIEAQLRP
jgi:hypothetical protein